MPRLPGFTCSSAAIVRATMASQSTPASAVDGYILERQYVDRDAATRPRRPLIAPIRVPDSRLLVRLDASNGQSPSAERTHCPGFCENDDGPEGLPSSPKAAPYELRAANSWRFPSRNPAGRCSRPRSLDGRWIAGAGLPKVCRRKVFDHRCWRKSSRPARPEIDPSEPNATSARAREQAGEKIGQCMTNCAQLSSTTCSLRGRLHRDASVAQVSASRLTRYFMSIAVQNFFCHANGCIVVSHYFACWRTNGLFIYRGSVREPYRLNHVPSFDLSYCNDT